jgi:hypothetical protein
MQSAARQSASEMFAKMGDDPRFDEASQMAFKHHALDLIGGDWNKPLAGKDLDVSKVMVQPSAPPPQVTQGIPAQTVQGPTPPPHPADQIMPFEQQLERLHAQTIASTKFPPMKVSSVKSMDPDGKIYDYATYVGTNPNTGLYEQWSVKSPNPVAYAPRAAVGAEINAEDEAKLRMAGYSSFLNNPSPEEMKAITNQFPGMRLVPTGYGSFYIASQKYKPESIAGQIVQVPQAPPTGNPMAGAQVAGQATPTLPRNHEILLPGPTPGTYKRVVVTSETEVPPPTQPSTAQPQPSQGQPSGEVIPPDVQQAMTQHVITPALMNFLAQKNPGHSSDAIRQALLQDKWQDASQTPAPSPPPSAGNRLQRGNVTDVANVGRTLSQEQITEGGTRLGVLGMTIGRGANVLNTYDQIISPKQLDSFLKRAQLQIVSNPASQTKFSLVVANKSQLKPEEAQFAADYASLGEDINVMRAITNATGFRGREAFEVLQGQRGNLLGNPDVFKRTLHNSLETIITQMGTLNHSLQKAGYQLPIDQNIFNGYMAVFGPDRKAVEAKLRTDGWIQ